MHVNSGPSSLPDIPEFLKNTPAYIDINETHKAFKNEEGIGSQETQQSTKKRKASHDEKDDVTHNRFKTWFHDVEECKDHFKKCMKKY